MKITIELDRTELTDDLVRALKFSTADNTAVVASTHRTPSAAKAVPVPSPIVQAAQHPTPVQPEPSSLAWHWCENEKCVEPIQIDHKVYINTQCCPKCLTSTLHEASVNSKKGAADERLAFLNKMRSTLKPATPAVPTAPTAPVASEAEPVKESEPAKYIICEVAEAPKKEPVAAPAQQIVPVAAPVQQTVPTVPTVPTAPEKKYTREDIIAAASSLVISHPEKREELKGFIAAINIKSLKDLPDELIPETADILREMGASL